MRRGRELPRERTLPFRHLERRAREQPHRRGPPRRAPECAHARRALDGLEMIALDRTKDHALHTDDARETAHGPHFTGSPARFAQGDGEIRERGFRAFFRSVPSCPSPRLKVSQGGRETRRIQRSETRDERRDRRDDREAAFDDARPWLHRACHHRGRHRPSARARGSRQRPPPAIDLCRTAGTAATLSMSSRAPSCGASATW